MARRKKGRRPRASGGLITFEEGKAADNLLSPDSALFELARRMRHAEQVLDQALDELASAEERLATLPMAERRSGRRPSWLVAAEEQEIAAVNSLERIFQQIATMPARTRFGIGLKVRITRMLYGESAHDEDNEHDLLLVMLESIFDDLNRGQS